jgi:hypothetical protein
MITIVGLIESRKDITPAKTGVQNLLLVILDSRLRGNDAVALAKAFYEYIKIKLFGAGHFQGVRHV